MSREYVHDNHWQNTIVINTGLLSPVDFNMSLEQKEFLFKVGYWNRPYFCTQTLSAEKKEDYNGTCSFGPQLMNNLRKYADKPSIGRLVKQIMNFCGKPQSKSNFTAFFRIFTPIVAFSDEYKSESFKIRHNVYCEELKFWRLKREFPRNWRLWLHSTTAWSNIFPQELMQEQ